MLSVLGFHRSLISGVKPRTYVSLKKLVRSGLVSQDSTVEFKHQFGRISISDSCRPLVVSSEGASFDSFHAFMTHVSGDADYNQLYVDDRSWPILRSLAIELEPSHQSCYQTEPVGFCEAVGGQVLASHLEEIAMEARSFGLAEAAVEELVARCSSNEHLQMEPPAYWLDFFLQSLLERIGTAPTTKESFEQFGLTDKAAGDLLQSIPDAHRQMERASYWLFFRISAFNTATVQCPIHYDSSRTGAWYSVKKYADSLAPDLDVYCFPARNTSDEDLFAIQQMASELISRFNPAANTDSVLLFYSTTATNASLILEYVNAFSHIHSHADLHL